MTGHQHANQRRKPSPAADHRLDQFAAAVAEARTTQPALAALQPTVDQFIDTAMDIGAHLDRPTLGAAWLILGQLFGTNLASTPPDQQAGVLAMLLNVARLAGERLYTGTAIPVEMPCPFPYGTGAPCKSVIKAPNRERADVLLGAHVWQQHPGETWPPVVLAGDGMAELIGEESIVHCACGEPAVMVRGVTNRPDGEPGEAQALCRDCAAKGGA